jgi:hypothetical protein
MVGSPAYLPGFFRLICFRDDLQFPQLILPDIEVVGAFSFR